MLMALCIVAFGVYTLDYYRAEESVQYALSASDDVNIYSQQDMVVFSPDSPVAGFVFYPGGKVECTAYAPLMKQLAENDILCVITEMPFNLAVFDIKAAEMPMEVFADIDDWYIGGHSLGGSMAAAFAAENADRISGLALLASYSTADLSDSNIDVVSVYGSEDGVLNMEKYDQYSSNLPDNTQEIVISGGNHAQFGSYGRQKGDGTATITAEAQLAQTAAAITDMIK
ncbi:MAG: alpha/beta hydrolase [Oscillospiraceae bacterium]|nr:alpha/beta hydrolase [Oscillospiraceae bacterium]